MRRLALLLAVGTALALPAAAAALSPAPAVDARAALVANGATGEVLFARNADRRLPIASITKIMTALVTLERARPGDVVTVSPAAASVGESSIFLRPGERVSVRDLLEAALIQSANDAAYALAAYVGHGDVGAFVRLMNAEARRLGLDHTHFVRPDGLDAAGHYSSARDVLALARVAMRKPLFRRIVRMRTATIAGGRSLATWNDLLGSFRGLIGVKTGHTLRAGWSEVAAARRAGVTIYAVVLGSPDRGRRNRDLSALLSWGFRQYAHLVLVRPGRAYAAARVPYSDSRRLRLVAARPLRAVVRRDRPVVEKAVAPAVVELPVERGEPLGEVRLYEHGKLLGRRALVASETIRAPSFGRKLGWYADRALDEARDMLESALAAIS